MFLNSKNILITKMKIKTLMTILVITLSLIPGLIVGISAYAYTTSLVKELSQKDLEERVQAVIHGLDAIDRLKDEKKLSDQEALDLAKDIFIGYKAGDERNFREAVHKGDSGFIWMMDLEGNEIGNRYLELEGENIFDVVTDEKVIKTIRWEINTREGAYESAWINSTSGESYPEMNVYDFYEPRELLVGSAINLDEFTRPVELIRNLTFLILGVSLVTGLFIGLFLSVRVTEPTAKISQTAVEISKGNLSSRIEFESGILEFNTLKKTLNDMIDSIQNNVQNLRSAISSYSKVLNQVLMGDYSIRVNTADLSEDYELLGETINSIISLVEYDHNELKSKEKNFSEIIELIKKVLHQTIDEEKYDVQIDIEKIPSEYKMLGEQLNELISSVQIKLKRLLDEKGLCETFFNAVPFPITFVTLEGKIQAANPSMEELVGKHKEELVGVSIEKIFAKEEKSRIRKKIVDECLKKERPCELRASFIKPDGIKVPVILNCNLLKNKQGSPVGILCTSIELTKHSATGKSRLDILNTQKNS